MKRSLLAPLSMLFCLGFASTSAAQPYQPLAQLKEFLQLSGTQVEIILTNNDEFNQRSTAKLLRVVAVQIEIVAETTKDVPQAMALGVRYLELETICRELKTEAATYRKKNIDTLTEPQKTKLSVLTDAIKLAPAIADAQSGNLLNPPGYYLPHYFTPIPGDNGNHLIHQLLSPPDFANVCNFSPFSTFVVGTERTAASKVTTPR